MEITEKLKRRFVKDCGLPINIFIEPFFMDRINLFQNQFNSLDKWNLFIEEINKYSNEEEYFAEYNRIKDAAIEDIKNSTGYNKFNEDDMNKFAIPKHSFPTKDIYKQSNVGRTFISIDMKHANFSALRNYSEEIFYADSWEEFISKYTDNKHIINSKYIRQVILGNCNPKRHITYEKYLMYTYLEYLLEHLISPEMVAFFSNDEIVIDLTGLSITEQEELLLEIKKTTDYIKDVPLKIEYFYLYKIENTSGYCKKNLKTNKMEYKCLDSLYYPLVLRTINREELHTNDLVFMYENNPASLLEIPEIYLKG